MKMLSEDIKNRRFKRVYLLMGEEIYLRNQYKKKLREALIDPEDTMNAATFEGKGIDPKAVIDLAETMPFLAPCRVIELQDSGFAQNACPELADYIPDIPESTCLILTESDVDRRGRVYKAVKKYGRVVEFKRQDQRTLVRWVLGTLKQEGRSITEETMRVFLGRTGADMENIDRELEKLLCYTAGRGVITTEDVENICTEQTDLRYDPGCHGAGSETCASSVCGSAGHEGAAGEDPHTDREAVQPAAAPERAVRTGAGKGRTGKGGRCPALCAGEIYGSVQILYKRTAQTGSGGLCGSRRTGEDRKDGRSAQCGTADHELQRRLSRTDIKNRLE